MKPSQGSRGSGFLGAAQPAPRPEQQRAPLRCPHRLTLP
ncbi:Uncharacterised protein [Bordetella pertussis]|nr:Uncharacterised protein [Bordetella pertussis]